MFNAVNDAELKWLNGSTDDYFSEIDTESHLSSYNYQPASYFFVITNHCEEYGIRQLYIFSAIIHQLNPQFPFFLLLDLCFMVFFF